MTLFRFSPWAPALLLGSLVGGSVGQAQSVLEPVPLDAGASPATIPPADAPAPDTIWAASFQAVTPGATSREQLVRLLGEPEFRRQESGREVYTYHIPGYQRVDFEIEQNIVAAVLLFFDEPELLEQIEADFNLKAIRPAAVHGDDQKLLGRVYPERGVVVSFAEDQTKASEVVLQPVDGHPFLLRAESHAPRQYTRILKDLDSAIRFGPQQHRAHWLRARLLNRLERYEPARVDAQAALDASPDDQRYQLTLAESLAGVGDTAAATELLQSLVRLDGIADDIQAEAYYQLGCLQAYGPVGDHAKAVELQQAAIKIAVAFVAAQEPAARGDAGTLLVKSHLAMANHLAWGPWKNKQAVVARWLQQASRLATSIVDGENGDPTLALIVLQQKLAAFAGMASLTDPGPATDEVLKVGRKLIAAADDRRYQQYVEQQLAEALFHAMQVEQARGNVAQARKNAENALAVLKRAQSDSQASTSVEAYRRGRLYFALGATYAFHEKDHDEAVRWYEKAIGQFAEVAVVPKIQQALHGDRFVSVGVSFWQIGAKTEAVEVTEIGVSFIRQAIDSGLTSPQVLAVPYANLAEMHGKLGNSERARNYQELAARLPTTR